MPDSPTLPRIAVVIPCYNSQEWIAHTINSVLAQSYGDFLLIVVDDGSKDASAEKVRAFGDRVILHTGPNRGAPAARNTGMAIAEKRGATYVMFLDADDYLEGELLAGAAAVAAKTGADMILSDMHIVNHDGTREERSLYSGRIAPETFFDGWLHGRIFHPGSIVWRIGFVKQIGSWDESLKRSQDTEIALRAMFSAPHIEKNDQGIGIYNKINPGSISRDVSPRSTESRIRAMAGIIKRTPGTPLEPWRPLLMERLYTITRGAFGMKQIQEGRQGVRELKGFGFRHHPGSWRHRLLASLLGLEYKVRLWGN